MLQWSVLGLGLALVGCSSGPTPPKPGSPAYLWAGAQTTYKSGDVIRAGENLEQLTKTDNEFAARARPWAVVLSGGITQGYIDLADNYDTGAKANRANPMPFQKESNSVRSLASSSALQFAENVHVFLDKDKDPNVLLAFEYPAGSISQPPSLSKIASGVLIQDSERDSLRRAMVQNGVLMNLCRVTGNPDDSARTLELMKQAEVKVPRATFLFAVAKALQEQSTLFGSNKLDRPDRLRLMLTEANAALAGVPESKDTKAVKAKIDAALKKIKGSV